MSSRLTAALTTGAVAVAVLAGCSTGPASTAASAGSPTTGGAGQVATTSPRTPAAPTPSRTATPTPTPVPSTASVTTPPVVPPPYVASVRWVTLPSGRSLQVRPTTAGRTTEALYPEAWSEVLRLAPDADTPGMRAQFSCHWTFARMLSPDKPSWNLEPWRPVVSTDEMISAGCNPGGAEE